MWHEIIPKLLKGADIALFDDGGIFFIAVGLFFFFLHFKRVRRKKIPLSRWLFLRYIQEAELGYGSPRRPKRLG
jgi:hypothetical protein